MKREEIIHTFNGVKKIAEVGVLRGKFANHLLSVKECEELHLIDPWKYFGKEIYSDHSEKTQDVWDNTYKFVQNKFSNNSKVKIHRLESVNAASNFDDGYFDLVYIDANHSYETVKEDINAWLPKINNGGWIGGHDICTPSVKKAVAEVFESWDETTEFDENTIGIKRPKSWFVKIKK